MRKSYVFGRMVGVCALALLAAACSDRMAITAEVNPGATVIGDAPVQLKATVSDTAAAVHGWRVAVRPEGSEASVADESALETAFEPDVAGVYEFEFSATTGSARTGGGIASGVGARRTETRRAKLTVTTVEADPARSSLAVTPEKAFANGEQVVEILVTAVDAAGKPISGAPVEIEVSGADNVLTPASRPTDAAGQAKFELVTTSPGRKTVKATFAQVSLTAQVEFINSGADLTRSFMTVDPKTSVRVNGESGFDVVVRLVDADERPLPGLTVDFSTGDLEDVFEPSPTAVTDEEGVVRVFLVSTKAGKREVVATFVGDKLRAPIVFAPARVDAERSTAEISAEEIEAGESATVTATLRDRFGNPVGGHPIHVGGCELADYDRYEGTTDEDGRFVVVVTGRLPSNGETCTVWVEWPEEESDGWGSMSVEFSIRIGKLSLEHSVLEASPSLLRPNGDEQSALDLRLTDSRGNGIEGLKVEWSVTGEGNELFWDSNTTDWRGETSATLTSRVAGTKVVTATFGDPPQTLSTEVRFSDRIPSMSHSYMNLSPQEGLVANGEDVVDIEVFLADEEGQPLEGFVVNFAALGDWMGAGAAMRMITPGDDREVGEVTPSRATTNAQGIARATFATTMASDWEIVADYGREPFYGEVGFRAGPYSPSRSSFRAEPSEVLADGTTGAMLVFSFLDAFDNPRREELVSFVVESGEGVLSSVEDWTDWNGRAYVSLRSEKPGRVRVKASGIVDSYSGEGRFERTVDVTFTTPPPVLRSLYMPETTNVCAPIYFTAAQANDSPVRIEFMFRDGRGLWKNATPVYPTYTEGSPDFDGGGSTDVQVPDAPEGLWPTLRQGVHHRFYWDMLADAPGFGAGSVEFKAVPFLGSIEGVGVSGAVPTEKLSRTESVDISGGGGKDFGAMSTVWIGTSDPMEDLFIATPDTDAVVQCLFAAGAGGANGEGVQKCGKSVPLADAPQRFEFVRLDSPTQGLAMLSAKGAVGFAPIVGRTLGRDSWASSYGKPHALHWRSSGRDASALFVVGELDGQGLIEAFGITEDGIDGEGTTVASVRQPLVDVQGYGSEFVNGFVALGQEGDVYLVEGQERERWNVRTFKTGARKATALAVAALVDWSNADVVVLDEEANEIIVLPAASPEMGDEGFNVDEIRRYPLASRPVAVAAAQLTSWTDDVVVALENGEILALRAEHDGPSAPVSVGRVLGRPVGLVVGRLDNDWKTDIAVALENGRVEILYGNFTDACNPG